MTFLKGKIKSKFIFFFSILMIFSFSSCKKEKPFEYDLSNFVEYLETPPSFTINDVVQKQSEFKKLEKKNFQKINNVLQDKNNFIWLKVSYEIPPELKNKELGIYISQFRAAERSFQETTQIRTYGSFLPNGIPDAFKPHYYMIPRTLINQDGKNSTYFQLWTGSIVSVSERFILAEQRYVFQYAEFYTFIFSRLTLCTSSAMILLFIVYFLLSIFLRKTPEFRSFRLFSLLLFHTAVFLIPFFMSEISSSFFGLSYITFLKITTFYGCYSTMYFAVSYILSYIQYEEKKDILFARLTIYIVSTLGVFFQTDYWELLKTGLFFIAISGSQFVIAIVRIIQAFKDPKRKNLAEKLILGFLPVYAALIIDVIRIVVFKQNPSYFITVYGWQLTVLVFLAYLIRQFSSIFIHNLNLKNQLLEFNAHLEDVVALRTKELSSANFVLSRGLESVAQVQAKSLPKKHKVFYGWDLTINSQPLSDNVSGDFYDYYYKENELQGLGLFDVSGHGITAGLVTVLAKGIINQNFQNGIAENSSISEILTKVNDDYIREKANIENYFTGLLFKFSEIDEQNRCQVEFANAGHPYPLLFSNKENKITELKVENPDTQYGMIGISGLEVSFPPVNFVMEENDILVCFTDGITETKNVNNELFGKESIEKILINNKDEPSEFISQLLINELFKFAINSQLSDDISVIVLKRTNTNDYLPEV